MSVGFKCHRCGQQNNIRFAKTFVTIQVPCHYCNQSHIINTQTGECRTGDAR